MSNRLLRLILALYPRSFRRRYGRELQDLLTDLKASGEQSWLSLASGLLLGAAAERLQTARRHTRVTLPTLILAAGLVATIGSQWLHGSQRISGATASLRPSTGASTRIGSVTVPPSQPVAEASNAGTAVMFLPQPPRPNQGSNWPSQ